MEPTEHVRESMQQDMVHRVREEIARARKRSPVEVPGLPPEERTLGPLSGASPGA
ncbi:hypothetical protein JKG47_12080 [Acidithiobacillus sp. MC6.1]|nr:hypothetical protein [Acidithiobacillus sp. MC6.1]